MMDSIPNIEPKIFSMQRRKLATFQRGIFKYIKTNNYITIRCTFNGRRCRNICKTIYYTRA